MKGFIKEYLKIITYATIGFVLVLSSFYLVVNYYHTEELKKTIYINSNDISYQMYNNKLQKINDNLKTFKSKNVTNTVYKKMYNKLLTCKTVLEGEGTLATIPTNTNFTSYDIYKLGSRFQNDILNVCWAMHLSYLTSDDVPREFSKVAPHVINSINMIIDQTTFAMKEIQNNSSYFYTTNITSSTLRNYLVSDYQIIANSYNNFADVILNLSELINNDINGGSKNG